MFLNNNVLTVAGSLSNSVTSLTVNGQTATVYNDLTWAVPDGLPLTSGLNRLTAVVTAGGLTMTNSLLEDLPATVALRYDADGNLTWDGLLAYTYDCADELTAVTLTNGWKTGYVYDGLGRRRIRKDYTWTNNAWAETNEVHYVYAGMNVIQERNSNNVPLVTYTRGVDLSGTRQGAGGIGGLLARTDANGSAYYHDDANGNVTALVNASGTVVAKYLYDSFGNTLGMWGSLAAGNTYRFSSKEMDARTGQYYYGYRWYDPNLQRWLNRNPIQEAGGINLYGFVGNNPIHKVDRLGLQGVQLEFDLDTDSKDDEYEGEITREIRDALERENAARAMRMRGLDPNQTYIGPASEGGEFSEFSDDDFEFLNKLRAMPPAGLGRTPCPPTSSNLIENAPSGFSNFNLAQQSHSLLETTLEALTGTKPGDWRMETGPGENGVDATYIGPESRNPGFGFAELKPYSQSGIDTFGDQLESWQLPAGQTQLFFYNAGGIIGSSGFNF